MRYKKVRINGCWQLKMQLRKALEGKTTAGI